MIDTDKVNGNDVGMAEGGRSPGFVLETLKLPGIQKAREGQNLQRYAPPE